MQKPVKLYREIDLPIEEWPQDIRADYEDQKFSPLVGSLLISETERVRIWILSLKPGQSASFHRHVLDYFWVATSNGQGRHYYEDGRMVELEYEIGDTKNLNFSAGGYMVHNAMNIGDSVLQFTTVEFLQSANAPLDLPDDTPRK